jgi:hypothetical protein
MRLGVPVGQIPSEEEYFHRLDCQLIDEMRERAAAEEERRRMAETSRIEDPRVLEALERLGYTHTTVILLHLVPLVELAWSDGSVSPAERKDILAVAAAGGLREETAAWRQLAAWLENCPSPAFFEGTWRGITEQLDSLPAEERTASKNALIQSCTDFASASCHRFGWSSHICTAKRTLLSEIRSRLERKREKEPAIEGAGSAQAA